VQLTIFRYLAEGIVAEEKAQIVIVAKLAKLTKK
jgi:hypothetical protein